MITKFILKMYKQATYLWFLLLNTYLPVAYLMSQYV